MKAVVFHAFRGNDVLEVQNMHKPLSEPDEVLTRVHAEGGTPLTGRSGKGRIKVIINKVLLLDEAKDALAYNYSGSVRGKIVLKMI